MKIINSLFLFATLALSVNCIAGYDEDVAIMTKGMPKQVKKVIERQVACNHWAGEEAYDDARAKEITTAVASLKCETLEQDELRLIKKYQSNAKVKSAIQQAKDFY
ncbi:MAG: hypothetical protein WBP13_11520 [Methylophilaceae bacterium]